MKRLLSVVVFAASAAVAAQEAGQQIDTSGPGNIFDSLDTDRDGYLSEKELQVSTTTKFKLEDVDHDKDGKVSRAELIAAFERGPAKDDGAAGAAGDLPASEK